MFEKEKLVLVNVVSRGYGRTGNHGWPNMDSETKEKVDKSMGKGGNLSRSMVEV